MRPELAQQFTTFKVPSDLKQAYKEAGKLNFAKTMLFAQEVQLTNSDIDYFMSIPPKRQEDESYEDMKIRSKFSKVLLKYRPYLYDYSVYND